MQATVRVGRLTVRPERGGRLGHDVTARLRAEALLDGLGGAVTADRSVLVLRRLTWRVDQLSPAGARDLLEVRRRTAVRPARTRDGARADAVLFADEVELLTCLTRDAVAGDLDAWYWHDLLNSTSLQVLPSGPLPPVRGGRIGAVLAAVWLARPRWVPAVLAALPLPAAVQAVSVLTPAEAAQVRAAVQAEYGLTVPQEPAPPLRPAGGSGGAHVAEASPQARHPDMTRPLPWTRFLPATAVTGLHPEQHALLGVALSLRTLPALARGPRLAVAVRTLLDADAPAPHTVAAAAPQQVEAGRPDEPPMAAAAPAREADLPQRRDEVPAATDAEDATPPGDSAESAPDTRWEQGVRSSFASALYLVNLLPLLVADDDVSAWALLDAVARGLLPDDQPDDPLWQLLAHPDAQQFAPASPVVPERTSAPASPVAPERAVHLVATVRAALEEHEVPVEALCRPGWITATATHLDVVLTLEQIDLAARVCGLDRDPGWVPELGRIVAFHFEGGDLT